MGENRYEPYNSDLHNAAISGDWIEFIRLMDEENLSPWEQNPQVGTTPFQDAMHRDPTGIIVTHILRSCIEPVLDNPVKLQEVLKQLNHCNAYGHTAFHRATLGFNQAGIEAVITFCQQHEPHIRIIDTDVTSDKLMGMAEHEGIYINVSNMHAMSPLDMAQCGMGNILATTNFLNVPESYFGKNLLTLEQPHSKSELVAQYKIEFADTLGRHEVNASVDKKLNAFSHFLESQHFTNHYDTNRSTDMPLLMACDLSELLSQAWCAIQGSTPSA